MNPFKPKPIQSLLGLSLHGRQLTAVVAHVEGTNVKTGNLVTTLLSLDPLTNDVELVAQEIRTFLDQHEIRETRCLLCLPSNLALATSIDLPELSDDDRQSYLDLQAESEFPFGVDDLSIASVPYQSPTASQHATLAATPKNHVARFESILLKARLRPLSVTLGMASERGEQSQSDSTPQLVLDLYPDHVDLSVRCDGGFAALRSLDEVFESEKEIPSLDNELLRREIKITLGPLTGSIRKQLTNAIICVQDALPQTLSDALEKDLAGLGFQTKVVTGKHSALTKTVEAFLKHQASALEFLPPKQSQFQAFADKVSSRGNAWAGGSVGTIVVLTAIVFYIQGYRLSSLEAEWDGMADKVTELETLQNKIRQFRPWYSRSAQSLQIAKKLSEAFPREGSIWVKSFEIKENNKIFCSGSANNNQALLDVMDQLRAMEDINDVTLQQVRGESPVQFAFNFEWKPGGNQ